MRLLFWAFFYFIIGTVTGQTYQIYKLQTDNSKGHLMRTEVYKNNLLHLKTTYNEDGKRLYAIDQAYENDLLKKKVKTFFVEFPYDLVSEYNYDEQGRLTGELFGNNLTGKWGSYRYEYNEYDKIKWVDIYQKNGDLTHRRHYKYTYNNNQQVVETLRLYEDLEFEEITQENKTLYQYPTSNTTVITYYDTANKEILKETNIEDAQGRCVQSTTIVDSEYLDEKFTYNKKGQIVKIEELLNHQPHRTINNQYNENGIRIRQTIQYANGKKEGEIYVLQ